MKRIIIALVTLWSTWALADFKVTDPIFAPPNWTTATRPTCPASYGCIGFNTDLDKIEIWDGTTWVVSGSGSMLGPVTSTPNTVALYADDTGKLLGATAYTIPVDAGNVGDVLRMASVGGAAQEILAQATAYTAAETDTLYDTDTFPFGPVQLGDTLNIISGTGCTPGAYTVITKPHDGAIQVSSAFCPINTSGVNFTVTRGAAGSASAEWQAISSSSLTDADGNTSIDVDITDDGAADVIVFANNSSETARFTADGRMGIGTDTPNPNAILDLSSTTKAFLLPRLNNAEMAAIPSPLNGMQVFNTDNKKVYFYNGSGWEATGIASTLFNLGITDAVATPTIPPDPTPPATGYKNGDFYIVNGFGNVAAVFNPSVLTAGTGDYLIFDHGADGVTGGGDDTWEKIAFSDVGQISRNGNTTDLHLMIWDQDNTNSAKDTGISSLDLVTMALNAPAPDFAVVSAGTGDKTTKLAPYTLPMIVGNDGDILVSDGAGVSTWKPVGDVVPAAITVEDNLTSTSATNALSANQGRVLNEAIEEKVSGPAVGGGAGTEIIAERGDGSGGNFELTDSSGQNLFTTVLVGDTLSIVSGANCTPGSYNITSVDPGGSYLAATPAFCASGFNTVVYSITRGGGGGGVVEDTVALFDGTTGRLIKATPYKLPLVSCAEGEILQADANGDFICVPSSVSRIHDADDNTFVDVEATGDINRISFGVEGIPNPMVIDSIGNVGIGTLDPDPNAILDLSSTTKAFLMPRLTVAQIQAIAAPVEGMQVMNIDSGKLVFYNGAAWEPAGVSSGMVNLGIVEANPYVAPTPPAEGYKQGEFYVVDGVGTLGLPFDDPVATGPDVATASTGDWLVFDDGGTISDPSDDGWNRVAFSDTGALTRGGNTLDNQIMFWDGDNNNVAKAIDGFLSANPGQLQLGSATSGTSGALILTTNAALQNIILRAPDVASANYVITLPTETPEEGQFLQTDVNGQLSWISVTGLAGDVVGPDTSTANTMAMFADATGKLLKESGYTVPATAGNLGDVLTISSAGSAGSTEIVAPQTNGSGGDWMGMGYPAGDLIINPPADYTLTQLGDEVVITGGTTIIPGTYTIIAKAGENQVALDRSFWSGAPDGITGDIAYSIGRAGAAGPAVATWEPAAITVVVEDSLISTSTDNALSANMGRVLNEKKVEGPATSVGDTFAMFDGTTGKFIKESSYKLPLAVCADGETLTSDGTNFLCTPVSVMSKTIYNANGFGGSATTNLSSFYFTNIRTPTNSDCYTVTNSPSEGFYITVNKACVFNISYSSSNIGGLLDSGFVLNPDANDLAGEFEQIAFSKKLCNTAVQGVTGSTGSCSFQWDGTIGEKIYLLGSASMTPDTPEKFAVSIMGFLPGSEIGVGVQAAAPTMVEVIPQRTDGEAGNGFPNLLTNPSGGAGTRGIFEGVVEVGDKVTITSGTSVTPGVYSVTAVEPDRVTVSGNFYIGSGLSQDVVYSVSRAIPSGQAGGTGDVVGPASSTLNSLAIYSDATGKLIGSKSGITFNDTSFADLTLGSNVIPYKLGRIALTDSNNNFLILRPAYGGASQTLTFPAAAPAANQILQSDATGQLSWIDTPTGGTGGGGTGDVVGPASSVDGAIATYDGTTGKLIRQGSVYIFGNELSMEGDNTNFYMGLGTGTPMRAGVFRIYSGSNWNGWGSSPTNVTSSYSVSLPVAQGTVGQTLSVSSVGTNLNGEPQMNLGWAAGGGGGSGDVVGPASSVDGQMCLFNGTTGKTIKAGYSEKTVAHLATVPTGGAGVVPTMTSNTAPAGYVASCVPSVSWCFIGFGGAATASPVPYAIKLKLPTNTTIGSYGFTGSTTDANYNPTGWSLEGSNNDSTWTVLDTKTNQIYPINTRITVTLPAPVTYMYYRFNINSSIAGSVCDFTNFQYYSPLVGLKANSLAMLTGVAADATIASTPYSLPNSSCTNGQILKSNGTDFTCAADIGGSGDVVGPASSVDGALSVFSGATGKTLRAGVTEKTILRLLTEPSGGASLAPVMTGNTAPAGYQAVCTPTTQPWCYATFAGDGGGQPAPWSVALKFPSATTVGTYAFDTKTADRNPVSWTVEGSSNGSTWTVVDTRLSQSLAENTRVSFSLASPANYLWYKFNVSVSGGGNLDVDWLQYYAPTSVKANTLAIMAGGGATNGGVVTPSSYSIPATIGTNGQVLQSNGTNLVFAAPASPSSIAATDITLTASGKTLKLDGNFTEWKNATANTIMLRQNPSQAVNYALTWPTTVPADGQVMGVNAAGDLSWVTPSGGGGSTYSLIEVAQDVGEGPSTYVMWDPPLNGTGTNTRFYWNIANNDAQQMPTSRNVYLGMQDSATEFDLVYSNDKLVQLTASNDSGSVMAAGHHGIPAQGGGQLVSEYHNVATGALEGVLVLKSSSNQTQIIKYPDAMPTANQGLMWDGTNWVWGNMGGGGGGSGDVVGPAGSADNAFALYDGTTGKLLKGYGMLKFQVEDAGMTIVQSFDGSMGGQRGGLKLIDDSGDVLRILQNHNQTASYDISFPTTAPAANTILESDATGQLSWIATPASDARLKTKIAPMEKDFLADIMALTPSTFEWTEKTRPTGTQRGLIAQDVMKVIPEAVYAKNGGTLDLNDRALIATLIGAMKQQQTQIEELKLELSKLKK